MNKKNKFIITLVFGIVAIIVGIFIMFLSFKNENFENFEKIEKLQDFEIVINTSYNAMPGAESKKAYFRCYLRRIERSEFLNQYEIKSINLNGKNVKLKDIDFVDSSASLELFNFHSEYYKGSNIIKIIIEDKNTNIKYLKKIISSIQTLM